MKVLYTSSNHLLTHFSFVKGDYYGNHDGSAYANVLKLLFSHENPQKKSPKPSVITLQKNRELNGNDVVWINPLPVEKVKSNSFDKSIIWIWW